MLSAAWLCTGPFAARCGDGSSGENNHQFQCLQREQTSGTRSRRLLLASIQYHMAARVLDPQRLQLGAVVFCGALIGSILRAAAPGRQDVHPGS